VNITSVFRKGEKKAQGNYRWFNPASVIGKVMEKILLENIPIHKGQERTRQHGFMKR